MGNIGKGKSLVDRFEESRHCWELHGRLHVHYFENN